MNKGSHIVDAKGLFVAILLKWRLILLVTVLFFAGGTVKKYHSGAVSAEATQTAEEASDSDEVSIADANAQEIKYLNDQIQAKREFLYNSPVIEINPYRAAKAEVTYYIDVDEEAVSDHDLYIGTKENDRSSDNGTSSQFVTEPVNSILTAYQQYVEGQIDWTEIAEKYNVSPSGLMGDLLRCSISGKSLTLKITFSSEETASDILNYVIEKVDDQYNEISATLGSYSVTKSAPTVSVGIDNDYTSWSADRIAELNNLMLQRTNLISYQTAFASTTGNAGSSGVSIKDAMKSGAKYGLVGLLGFSALIALMYLISGRLMSTDDAARNFEIEKTVTLHRRKRNGKYYHGLDRAILNINDENRSGLSDEQRINLFADQMRAIDKNSRIVVVGSYGSKYSSYLADLVKQTSLQQAIVLTNVEENIDERHLLAAADIVILAVDLQNNTFNEVRKVMKIVSEYDQKPQGMIAA